MGVQDPCLHRGKSAYRGVLVPIPEPFELVGCMGLIVVHAAASQGLTGGARMVVLRSHELAFLVLVASVSSNGIGATVLRS